MSKPHPSIIRLADQGDFCISYKSLHLIAKLPRHALRITGPGFDCVREFALLTIGGGKYIVDVITGTLYDERGEDHNNPRLQVHGVPQVWPGKCAEVSA